MQPTSLYNTTFYGLVIKTYNPKNLSNKLFLGKYILSNQKQKLMNSWCK